jgi:hypothetical protein
VKWIGLFIGMVLTVAFAVQLPKSRVLNGQNDFLQFYGGATLAGTGQLHSPEAMKQVHLREAGMHLPAVQYVRPDYYAVALKPLAWLPFKTAYALFQLLNLLALAGFLWLFRDAASLKWMVAMSIPLAVSFANGQDVPLVLFLMALALQMHQRGWPVWAGVILALCTIKLHFLIFVPVVLILWKQWRVIAGGAAAMVALIGIGAISEGWDWVLRYPGYLRRPEIHPDGLQFINLRGILMAAGITDGAWVLALTAGTALSVLAGLWLIRRRSFETGMAAALLGGLLLSYHLGVHDCSLFLLIIALAPAASWLGRGAIALAFPLPYYFLMLDGWIGAIPAILLCALAVLSFHEFVKYSEDSESGSRLPAAAR